MVLLHVDLERAEGAFPQDWVPFHRRVGLRNRGGVVILRKSRKAAKNKAIRGLHIRVACATLKKLQM